MAYIIENNRQGAEVYTGPDLCRRKMLDILQEHHLPCGLLPLTDLEEVGLNRSTGFLWLKRKKEITHYYKQINRTACSGKVVTAYIQDKRMSRITSIKVKLLFWVSVLEMGIEDPLGEKVTFKSTTGIKKAFPTSAFEME